MWPVAACGSRPRLTRHEITSVTRSARFRSIAFVIAPRLPWAIQQEGERVQNIAAYDADWLIGYQELPPKRAAKHQQLSADRDSGARSAVERQQLVGGAGLLEFRGVHRGRWKQRHVSARIDQEQDIRNDGAGLWIAGARSEPPLVGQRAGHRKVASSH